MDSNNSTNNSNNSNDTNALCERITVDTTFFILTCTLLLVSLVALTVHLFFSFLLRRSQAFHSNVRLLLQNFSISACYVSLHSVGRCCYNFVVLYNGLSAMSALRCEWIETIFNASEGSLTLSMAFIGLDRLISTIRRKHVDSERPTSAAQIMVLVAWAAGTAFHTLSLSISFGEGGNRLTCYCQEMLVTPMSILHYMVAAFFITELSTAVCYVILYRYSVWKFSNFTINTAKHSLAERHQMMSNVKTSIILCPSIILHGSIYAIISLSFLPLRMYIGGQNYASHIDYALTVLIVMELEMMTQAILLVYRKDTLRKAAATYVPGLGQLLKAGDDERKAAPDLEIRTSKVVPVNAVDVAKGASGRRSARNVAGRGMLIDFRMKPEDNDDILNAMWAASGPRGKGTEKNENMTKYRN